MLWGIVMAGGSGTRFWPESRAKTPKQFLRLYGPKTLFEATIDRIRPIVNTSRIFVVTQDSLARYATKLGSLPPSHGIGEPAGRNTAPCAILAAAMAVRKDPDAVLALLPADHKIGNPKLFQKVLLAAHDVALREKLPITFGIQPTHPHTGYGYLELAVTLGKERGMPVYRLKSFCEKPSLLVAKRFVESKNFFWNSGIFVWHAASLLEEAKRQLPEAYEIAQKILSGDNFRRQMKTLFPSMPNTSIDYGLMEKMKGRILTMPLDLEWNDLGGWQAFYEMLPKDASKNVAEGKAVLIDSTGNFVRSSKKLIAMVGVQDLIVVDTDDALLICPRTQAESIRKIVSALKDKGLTKYL